MAKLKDEVFIQDLKHIWNDVIGPPAFSVHRATEGTSVMKQADVLEWMNNSGVYHMKQNLWSLWLRMTETERRALLKKAFPHEEYTM